MNNVDWKKFFASKTVRGILVAAVAFILAKLGVPEAVANQWVDIILNLLVGGGLVTALYGRTVAPGSLLKTPPANELHYYPQPKDKNVK